MKELQKSKHGEGIGGPVQDVEDPNAPSFDPATHQSATDEKIRFLLSDNTRHLLTPWELSFAMEMYGKVPLSRKQHIKIYGLYKKHAQRNSAR